MVEIKYTVRAYVTTSFVLFTDIAMWDHRDIHPQGEFFQSTLFNDSSVPIQFTSKRYNRRYWGICGWATSVIILQLGSEIPSLHWKSELNLVHTKGSAQDLLSWALSRTSMKPPLYDYKFQHVLVPDNFSMLPQTEVEYMCSAVTVRKKSGAIFCTVTCHKTAPGVELFCLHFFLSVFMDCVQSAVYTADALYGVCSVSEVYVQCTCSLGNWTP